MNSPLKNKEKNLKLTTLGFTLIELLAVIVILAILALIVSPIISGVISDAKKASAERSTEGYIKAVEYAQVQYQYKNKGSITQSIEKLSISAQGLDKITVTSIEFSTSGIVTSATISVDGYTCNYSSGKTTCYKGTILTNEQGSETIVPAKVYGLRWDSTDDTYTRLLDAVGMKAIAGVGTTEVTNNFDEAEIYKDIKDVEVDGNSFVKIPKFYIKKVVSDNTWEWYISKDKIDSNYYLPLCFYDHINNKELDYVLIGKYNSSLNGEKLESKTDTTCLCSISLDTARTYAMNNNADGIIGYQLFDIHAYDAIQVLFYVEYATLNSQSIMYGYASTSNKVGLKTGTTDSVVASSGSTSSNTNGLSAMKYRGIENLWGNYYQYVDGVYINNITNKIYVNKKPDTYSNYEDMGTRYYAIGYNKLNTSGWTSKMGYDSSNPFIQLPAAVDGSSAKKYGDFYYMKTSDNTIMRVGGNKEDGTAAGITITRIDSSSTYLYGSPRLLKKPL